MKRKKREKIIANQNHEFDRSKTNPRFWVKLRTLKSSETIQNIKIILEGITACRRRRVTPESVVSGRVIPATRTWLLPANMNYYDMYPPLLTFYEDDMLPSLLGLFAVNIYDNQTGGESSLYRSLQLVVVLKQICQQTPLVYAALRA